VAFQAHHFRVFRFLQKRFFELFASSRAVYPERGVQTTAEALLDQAPAAVDAIISLTQKVRHQTGTLALLPYSHL